MVFPLRYPLKGLIPHTLSEEDKLAAEAILAEALAAKKRADQFGVLSYLKREPVRSKVPNTGFLKNVLSHTVGFNRAQQRKEEELDRRRKDRKRKRSPEPRRSGKRRAELDVEETKSEEDGKITIGPTRKQFVSRRGRGTFAFSGEGCTIDELFKDEDSIPDLRVPQPLPKEEKEATNDCDLPLYATPKTGDRLEGKRKKQRRKQEKKEKKHKKHKKKHKKRKKGSD